ncbi:MAG: tyrosine-type recombinase/integrase, partial [Lachnospiraceae bacterium]|nr:tyrosine-type recombinase/integrase [Lachnospiraceae bacterium]
DAFCRLRNRLGMECRFHDLRHYAASILHAIGVPDQYIMERGGWSTDGTLKAIYRNTLSDKSRQFSAKANDYFDNNLLAGNGDS